MYELKTRFLVTYSEYAANHRRYTKEQVIVKDTLNADEALAALKEAGLLPESANTDFVFEIQELPKTILYTPPAP